MIPRRASHLKNGVTRSLFRSPSIVSSALSIHTRTGCRNISFLEVTSSESGFKRSDIGSAKSNQDSIVARLGGSITNSAVTEEARLPIELEADEDAMNASREAELLAMQHIFGLKDASNDPSKIKPKELERLQRLKAAEPVFVCIDLEAYEFAQEKITEVGVSILDSRHVVGTDPGPDGMEWLSKITTRHLIIKEFKHLVNKRFVHGCPDKFNFGKSEIVPLSRVHNTLTQLFANPSSGSTLASDGGLRKLILVGHGLSNDTAYMSKLKFDPHAKGNIIQDVDTQKFVGTKKQTVGLSRLMAGLGVNPENLHNAGNDAAYTLQALLLMTVQHTNDPGAYVKAVAEAKGKVDPAKQRYKDHKAKLREQNQEKAKAARAARLHAEDTPKHTVESIFAGPLKEHEEALAGIEANKTYNLSKLQQQPEVGSAAWESYQSGSSHYVPTSTIPEPEGRIQSRAPARDEAAAQGKNAETSLKKDGQAPPSNQRLPLANQPDRVADGPESAINRAPIESFPRKRKSPDSGPTREVWDDEDEFSISPSFHLQPRGSLIRDHDDNDGGVSITNTESHNNPTPEATAQSFGETTPEVSTLRITKQLVAQSRAAARTARAWDRDQMRERNPGARVQEDSAKQTGDDHTSSSITISSPPDDSPFRKVACDARRGSIESSAAASPSDQPVVRKMNYDTPSVPERLYSAARFAAKADANGTPSSVTTTTPQESSHFTVRWIPTGKDESSVNEKKERSHDSVAWKPTPARSPTKSRTKESERVEPPEQKSKDIQGFLRTWLDGDQ
jgi:hypothetical protein